MQTHPLTQLKIAFPTFIHRESASDGFTPLFVTLLSIRSQALLAYFLSSIPEAGQRFVFYSRLENDMLSGMGKKLQISSHKHSIRHRWISTDIRCTNRKKHTTQVKTHYVIDQKAETNKICTGKDFQLRL